MSEDEMEMQNNSGHLSGLGQKIEKYPRQPESLEQVTLRELRQRNKQTENAIKAVKSRINYMKNKEEKTVRKVLHVRRKLTSLEEVRNKAQQAKNQSVEGKRRFQEDLERKSQFNKLIKDHLKYNKKIVMTLMNHKVQEEVKQLKERKQQFNLLYHIQKDTANEEASEMANKVRTGHIEAHEKRKVYFLEKLRQFKDIKEKKLYDEIRQRQKQENLILELEQKERMLLERLQVSEKFRIKCQSEYEDAKSKYNSFYEAARRISREPSDLAESKAQIFIS